jgi:hypothetical protein
MYDQSFTWLKQTTNKNTDNGQEEEVFSNNGTLFGSLVLTNGSEQDEYGALQAISEGEVRLRQFPAITALDRLLHKQFNEVYVIKGVYKNQRANETVLQVKLYENLNIDGEAAVDGFILLEDSELIEEE